MRMRKVFIIFALCFFPTLSFAAHAEWSPVTLNTDGSPAILAGYNIYDVTAARVKINPVIIPTTVCIAGICSFTLPVTPVEGQKFVVTANGTNGMESGDSNIATYKTTPAAAGGLIIKFP